jgi:hypothetical protein
MRIEVPPPVNRSNTNGADLYVSALKRPPAPSWPPTNVANRTVETFSAPQAATDRWSTDRPLPTLIRRAESVEGVPELHAVAEPPELGAER